MTGREHSRREAAPASPAPEGKLILERSHNQPPSQVRDPRKNVEINIGKACNNRCVFCLDGLPKQEDRSYMPWPQMQAELTRWYDEGYRSVGFLGGEPTTYPRICDSISYARDLGFTRIAIATNATKLRLPHFTDRILAAGLTRATISMHGHTADLEDRLTRVPGNFDKKCAAIRGLVARKQSQGALPDGLSINIVLNGWNFRHLPRMLRFFYEELGVDDVRANFIRPEGYADRNADLTPEYSKVVPWLVKAIILAETHFKRVFTFGGFPLCVLPPALRKNHDLLSRYMGEYRDLSTACSIRTDGGEFVPEGAVLDAPSWEQTPASPVMFMRADDDRVRFNWQDRKQLDLKGRPNACAQCDLTAVCEGVWKPYLEVWGGDAFRPIRWEDTALAAPSAAANG